MDGITKSYRSGDMETPVLHGISLDIPEGEFVAIMGPSGSGKSTLMNIMGFLDVHDIGKYEFNGRVMEGYDEEELADIRNGQVGFVFQMFYLLPKLSAFDNVRLPMIYAGLPESVQKQKATEALTSVGLEERMHHLPGQLSGGQQQRVAIARAIVNTPSVIFADEPTGNLDSKSGDEVMEIFTKLHKQGRTIIMITHEDEIAAYAQRKIILRDGLISEDSRNVKLKIKNEK